MLDSTLAEPAPLLTRLDLDPAFCAWALGCGDLRMMWETCDRPEWLMALATKVGVERALLVEVACACAELASDRAGMGSPLALELARRWIDGRADGATCWAAGFRAVKNLDGLDAKQAAATRAVAAAAFACDTGADDSYYATRAHAAEAVSFAVSSDRALVPALLQRVRASISYDLVAECVDRQLRSNDRPSYVERTDLDADLHAIPQGSPRTFTRLR